MFTIAFRTKYKFFNLTQKILHDLASVYLPKHLYLFIPLHIRAAYFSFPSQSSEHKGSL